SCSRRSGATASWSRSTASKKLDSRSGCCSGRADGLRVPHEVVEHGGRPALIDGFAARRDAGGEVVDDAGGQEPGSRVEQHEIAMRDALAVEDAAGEIQVHGDVAPADGVRIVLVDAEVGRVDRVVAELTVAQLDDRRRGEGRQLV